MSKMGLFSLVTNIKWAEVFSEAKVDQKWRNYYNIFNHYFSTACPLVRVQDHRHPKYSMDE
jgi:hypothetical protein